MTVEDSPLIRDVASPLTRDMLRPLDPRCEVVQFRSALAEGDYRMLADWLRSYPAVNLRAYGSYDGSIRDLDFLRFFPGLRRFSANALYHSLESIEGLGYLPADTQLIGLGPTRKRLSLGPLARFSGLRRLYLEGQTKDIEVISQLTSLTSLTLRSVTLPGLALLRLLTNLRALDIKLGGTRDLSLLPAIGRLEYLELWLIRGLADLTPLASVTSLRYLFLQALKQVTELPSLSRLPELEKVWLETMKGLTDLRPLLTASGLRQVAVIDMRHLQPADVAVLAAHPRLEHLQASLGSKKKNDELHQLLPLSQGGLWARPAVLRGG